MTVKKKPVKNTPNANPNPNPDVLKIFAGIIKAIGIPGFLVAFVSSLFWYYGTTEQKREFIDRFILLKGYANDPNPAAFVVSFLVFILILGAIYHVRMQALDTEEIERISREKRELQEQLTRKRLPSTNN